MSESSELASFDFDQLASTSTGDQSNTEVNISQWSPQNVAISLALFILAGIFEIGGGFLIWRAVKENQHRILFCIVGSVVLIVYGFIPTLQPVSTFGRIFAVYGGFFIVLSYVWAVIFDSFVMDIGDYVGTGISLAGVLITWFWPR